MEKPKHTAYVTTNFTWPSLRTAEDVANRIKGLLPERIMELSDGGYMPHYRIDGGEPLFKLEEVKAWVKENLIISSKGREYPRHIRVVAVDELLSDEPPDPIKTIYGLEQVPVHQCQTGVYFLCKDNKVLYVGQSIQLMSRICSHLSSKVDYDRVYILPLPQSELNNVEGALIKHLKPEYNGRTGVNKKEMVSPSISKPIGEILGKIGLVNATPQR